MKKYLHNDVIELKSYKVIIRPGCKHFFEYCYSKYNVGFFSSTLAINAQEILKHILTPEQMNNTVLFWFRDRTRIDYENGTYDTIKYLEDIYDNPIINEHRQYSNINTILVDDSVTKTRYNDPNNIIICPQFDGASNDVYLYQLGSIIDERFNYLAQL